MNNQGSKVKLAQFWRPFIIAFFVSVISIVIQPMGTIDRVWSDVMLTSEKVPAPQQYLIVDVTSDDVNQFGGLPIPRDVLTKALTRLKHANAERVLLDITLSAKLSSSDDGPLLSAMESLGVDGLAIPPMSDSKFYAHATSVDLRLRTDHDGWTRGVRTSNTETGYNPALWLATGQLSNEDVNIDMRLDPVSVERVSLGDILEKTDMNLSGRLVIMSPNSWVLQSRVQLPLSEISDRAVVIALGGASISNGYQTIVKRSWLSSVGIALGLMVVGVFFAMVIQSTRLLLLTGLMMSVMVVALNVFLMKLWGGPGYPIMQFSCFMIGLVVSIGYRLRLIQMISSFMKGDLSPEEAWAWRAFEDSQSPVMLLNVMGNIRRMNPAADNIRAWLGEDFGERCLGAFRHGAKEISLQDQNGFTRFFALERPNGDVPIVVMKDMTQTARKFDELEANRVILQNTIDGLRASQVRAVERADSYEQKRIRAEETSQLKSEFLANMSHELRTPLNAINGFSDIMQRELFGPLGDPRYKEFANDILFSGQHLLSIINDILDLSKIEAGKMNLHAEPIQTDTLISQVIRMLRGRAEEGHLQLIYNSAALPQIEADPRAVKQVLLNLLTNAIKFTPEGGRIVVSTQAYSTGLTIRVADSGIGISQADIGRLAQPFAQVESEYSKTKEGTGLGLALSKSLIELHGGTLLVQSMLGKGTAVTITLPNKPPTIQTRPAA